MNNALRVLVIIGIVLILIKIFAPLLVLALIAGFLYTVYTRYQESKSVNISSQDFTKYEEVKKDLEVLEAEYEEKSQ